MSDETKTSNNEQEPLKASDCPIAFPYPSASLAIQAAQHLIANRATILNDKPCLLHCGWVIQGAVQSLAAPVDHPPIYGAEAPAGPDVALNMIADALEPAGLSGVSYSDSGDAGDKFSADVVGKIDWAKLFAAVKYLWDLFSK